MRGPASDQANRPKDRPISVAFWNGKWGPKWLFQGNRVVGEILQFGRKVVVSSIVYFFTSIWGNDPF